MGGNLHECQRKKTNYNILYFNNSHCIHNYISLTLGMTLCVNNTRYSSAQCRQLRLYTVLTEAISSLTISWQEH